jgi:hypothetical protein
MSVHSPCLSGERQYRFNGGPKKQAVGWSRPHRAIAITLRENAASAPELRPSRATQLFGKCRCCMQVRAPFALELRPKLAARRGGRKTALARSYLTISNSPSRSHGAFLRPGFAFWLRYQGWRSAERRTDACEASVGPALSGQARHLARRLASPYGGRPPPGAHTVAVLGAGAALPLTGIAAGSVTANSHVRVVVPGGGPLPPGATVANRRRGTPRLAPSSGSSLEHAP